MQNLSKVKSEIEKHKNDYEYLDIATVELVNNELHITVEQMYDVDIEYILKLAKKYKLNCKLIVVDSEILMKVY